MNTRKGVIVVLMVVFLPISLVLSCTDDSKREKGNEFVDYTGEDSNRLDLIQSSAIDHNFKSYFLYSNNRDSSCLGFEAYEGVATGVSGISFRDSKSLVVSDNFYNKIELLSFSGDSIVFEKVIYFDRDEFLVGNCFFIDDQIVVTSFRNNQFAVVNSSFEEKRIFQLGETKLGTTCVVSHFENQYYVVQKSYQGRGVNSCFSLRDKSFQTITESRHTHLLENSLQAMDKSIKEKFLSFEVQGDRISPLIFGGSFTSNANFRGVDYFSIISYDMDLSRYNLLLLTMATR